MAEQVAPIMEDTELPHDAPTMPRYPTLIRGQIPRGNTGIFEEDPSFHNPLPDTLQPPPRFPSMPDVELNKAMAAAGGAPVGVYPGEGSTSELVGRQLEQEIAATIERDAVEPGAARARASAAASKQWSSMDQRRLNSLLRDANVEGKDRDVALPGPGTTTTSGTSARAAFPTPLATVPMTVYSAPGEGAEQVEHFIAEDDINEKHGAMVKSTSSSAKVVITEDFGLIGGHKGVVHDTVFFDSNTLVTGGADGKVCIWDLSMKYVKSSFEPYNGNAVQALYPIVDEEGSATHSLITLSVDRLMRVWNLVDGQAVLLRSMQIPVANRDLVMSVPVLTAQMKAHAAAVAAAAAVAPTTDYTEDPPPSLDPEAFSAHPKAPAYRGGIADAMRAKEISQDEQETTAQSSIAEQPKRFSFNIFGRRNSKKAVAS